MVGRAAVLVALAACGRVDFEARTMPDAMPDAGPPICGDGVCGGTAGELCSACSADCSARAIVCGNAECQAGESPGCYADCGPSPWSWLAEEQALVNEINRVRTTGAMCPGELIARNLAAYAVDLSFQQGPREAAWEIAHHNYFFNNGDSCNGRSFGERVTAYGYDGQTTQRLDTSAVDAVASWISDPGLCELVLSPTYTAIAPAYADDVTHAWIVGYR